MEVKLECHESISPPAFGCFYDVLILVRGALDEIVSQLPVSNCLLVFKNTTSRLCKEVISQPALFHLLKEDPEAVAFLEESLFLQNPQLRSCCLFGDQIPASWIRYEALLDVCSELGKNDGLSEAQLEDLIRLIGADSSTSARMENASYECRLNRLLEVLMDWRDGSGEPTVGLMFSSLEAAGLMAIVEPVQESLPIFVLKDPGEHVG